MKRIFTEDDLQKAQVTYLESRRTLARDVFFCAIPNAAQMITSRGQPNYKLSQYLRSQGLVPGAPDLIVWQRGRTFHIENKVKGRRQSADQESFEAALKALGHSYHLISAETPGDAVTQLEELLGS